MQNITQPLTNVQLEILKAFSFNLEKNELKELKKVIAHYFAQRAIKAADKQWDKNGWTDQDVDTMLHTKMRKSNKNE